MQKGSSLALQMDVTATPKHNNGAIFVQTVAIIHWSKPSIKMWSNILFFRMPQAEQMVEQQSAKYTEKYADYIHLGVIEWRKAYAEHEKMGKKAILFVMTDDTKNCDEVAEYLEVPLSRIERCSSGDSYQ